MVMELFYPSWWLAEERENDVPSIISSLQSAAPDSSTYNNLDQQYGFTTTQTEFVNRATSTDSFSAPTFASKFLLKNIKMHNVRYEEPFKYIQYVSFLCMDFLNPLPSCSDLSANCSFLVKSDRVVFCTRWIRCQGAVFVKLQAFMR